MVLKIVLIALVVLVAAVLLYAATKPGTFAVQRDALIAAPAEKVFPLIADMKAFNTWNPWLRRYPASPLRYEGPPRGPGAAYAWDSKKLGAGRMEVLEESAPSRLALRLDFLRPMKSTNRVEFTLEPQAAAQTRVTWRMSGPMPYVSKLMSVFFDMDRMIGLDFEAGLANLRVEAEKAG